LWSYFSLKAGIARLYFREFARGRHVPVFLA